MNDNQAISEGLALLQALLEIPSLSGQERSAVDYLVAWMVGHGFQAFVDEAGNAVGVRDGGPAADGRPPQDIVLLGHIDTVGGVVPIRIEEGRLYGRGAVDAKGPLAAFAVAAAQVQPQPGWRIVIIAAVEEEAATSKGARYAATRYQPSFCVIGEPSGWNRITLGYKGRLLADVVVEQSMLHTAGPHPSACELAVDYWNRVRQHTDRRNSGRARAWNQVLPSLRGFSSHSDGLSEQAELRLGFRLPPDLGPETMKEELRQLVKAGEWPAAAALRLRFAGEEEAFRGDKNNPLVRAFLAAIRGQGGRPGFVLKTGTSDMNVVGPAWACPIVAYGPGDSRLDHTPQEHVLIAEWQHGVSVLREVLARLTR